MGLFTRKKSSFSNMGIDLGSSRPVYLKPSKKELKEIASTGRISLQPHGVKPRPKQSRAKRYAREGRSIVSDFQQLNPTSVNEFSSGVNYDSKGHLYRNLGL